jgi:hypothetical protein
MQNQPVEHDTKFPVTASAGADNAYYLRHCSAIERGPSYAACLSRLHDIDVGVSNERTAQCDKAVREGRCVAHGMREQESLAGTALFYFPRTNKPFLPVSVAGDFGVLITNLTDPALIPKPVKAFGEKPAPRAPAAKVEQELQVDALAVAITNAAAKPENEPAKQQPEITPEPAPAATFAPTEEPAKMATNMVAQMCAGTAPKIQPGETPLQFARRMAALRNAKQ